METVPFLRDVDDEKHFAQLLEVAYVEAYCELDKILRRHYFNQPYRPGGVREISQLGPYGQDFARLRFVMNATVQQTIERRRRLADVAAGLADLVLDKEGSKE